ncbi:MAG: hypothetical protein A2X05_11290 [Bacteroidetes bacterium GWE2_41_25]|nr:MAG: hypothetical protein A2X03_04630 [Bacteroidetes bacterium GWA2_40_15]OFX87928.1 MAG: hypothetical protein A2X06_08500 [Bacteroidetes bacterium GWC2_40_22]OFX96400.1 MAG: hypothetical protein A2X05_11290 [Bacteroidetes bacterium GWE2_41_25]OFY59901.1 MAG: hypothetical protein A2X04_02050 [Bacteroidetes bacterium GWF2_41_9]HAM08863.1 hypothetical protein [Bacteroidales bacterium]
MRKVPEIYLILFFLINVEAFSQEEVKRFDLNGYVSTMESVIFDSLSGPFIVDNLLHNRINFKGYLNRNITFATELRNRLFVGDMVRTGPSYSEMTGMDPGWVDMSWNILNEQSFFLNTTIDRLWVDFNYDKFQARVGRQRINWGQTLVWNPNDIFNVYSFFEFDYIERPGSDAVRLQYYPDYSSAIELAVKADYDNRITAAALYRFNKWGYDFQLLSGYFNSEDFIAGAGWSGAFGSVSFRGEMSWFQPVGNLADSSGTGIFTIGFDKAFRNNSMVQIQIMYSNNPADYTSFLSFYTGSLSTKELAFSKFTPFGLYSCPVTPLLNISASGMWFPDLEGYFAGLSLDFSMAENVDFSLFWQHFRSEINNTESNINLGFLRLKYSF